MKLKFHISFLLTAIAVISCSSKQSLITDIIKPINLISGISDSILVSDLFYAEDYEIDFKQNASVRINYNKPLGYVHFTPDLSFSGMTFVDFNYDGELYSILIKSRIQQKYKFSFKPSKDYKALNLFGSFNGWDRGNLTMNDVNGDGIFEVEIPLEPGRYQYKFFGDGEEIVDPLNKEKVPNGFGDFNSVFIVEQPKASNQFLHILDYESQNEKTVFNFYHENESIESSLKHENIFAVIDNKKITNENISVEGNKILISFTPEELKNKKLLRVTVSQSGNISNTQSVNLFDGNSIATENNFLWNDAIIYSLMIDRFNDGDKSLNKPIIKDSLFEKANYMGGDFDGIIKKLKERYFDSLGINTIWLSPVYDNPNEAYRESPIPHRWFSGYHGYWPVNSYDVEEKFGTLEKLKELIKIAHTHGIKILLDVVANHVHEKHPLVKEKPEWFGDLRLPDGRLNLRLWDEYRLTTWFEPYLPKFNYVNSKDAIDFMTSNAIWWLNETSADGFRQDAVKHMPNEFWRALTKRIKKEIEVPQKKSVYQIGETFGSYQLISSYVNNGQLSAQFNFNLYDVALPTFLDPKISFSALDAEMKKSFLVYGENHVMGNIMDSHDKNRFMAFADGDLDLSQWSAVEVGWNNPPQVDNPKNYKKAILYYAYMNSIPGIPVIYYGSEFGMTGASDPDNRRMMRFGNNLSIHESEMLNYVRKIINLRKNYSSFRQGDFLTLQADENVYAYVRSNLNERILVILNKNKKEELVNLKIPNVYEISSAIDLMNGEMVHVENNTIQLKVNESGYKFIKLEKK